MGSVIPRRVVALVPLTPSDELTVRAAPGDPRTWRGGGGAGIISYNVVCFFCQNSDERDSPGGGGGMGTDLTLSWPRRRVP